MGKENGTQLFGSTRFQVRKIVRLNMRKVGILGKKMERNFPNHAFYQFEKHVPLGDMYVESWESK